MSKLIEALKEEIRTDARLNCSSYPDYSDSGQYSDDGAWADHWADGGHHTDSWSDGGPTISPDPY